ncbi:cytochrome P450 [Streptomyces sp. NPDC056921]|uniref:cytochrome P450 n=1 Tax=Streptomyces sp. NPDC056921 TaxID=3345966 RepID=UPI003644988E
MSGTLPTAPERSPVTELASVNLADPSVHAEHDLAPMWQRLRAREPVARHDHVPGQQGFWVISRHADVMAVYRQPDFFGSAEGNVMDTLLHGGDSSSGRMLAVSDGEQHRGVRRTVQRGFSAEVLDQLGRSIRAATGKLLAQAVERGSCDFAKDVAAHIPIAAICELLGVPAADSAYIMGLSNSALGSDAPGQTQRDAQLAQSEILVYFAQHARKLRGSPGSDLVSMLTTSEVDGRPVPDDVIVFNCYSLVLGGDETTRLSMVGGLLALIEHPEQWQRFKNGDIQVDRLVEEVMRWTTPAIHVGRTALRDTMLGGRKIAEGDVVTLWNTSANMDEEVFADPTAFDCSRWPNRHVSFGFGPHFCVGAQLGRLELEALFSAVRVGVSRAEPSGPVGRFYSNFLSGISSLPIVLHR